MRFSYHLLVVLFLVIGTLTAADIYVPDNQPTIQDAIAAAATGDTVIVRPGTWLETIDFLGKAITLRSESGPGVTVIDGNQAGTVVTFQSGEGAGSVLEGFTITNGTGTDIAGRDTGGGVLCGPASSPSITGNVISDNDADDGAGIATFTLSSPAITANEIRNNTAKYGGAINLDDDCTPVIADNLFVGNRVTLYGGAIRCAIGCDAQIERNAFDDNRSSAGRGGAIYNYNSAPLIRHNSFVNNFCLENGGAIYNRKSTATISYNSFTGNSTSEYGGAVHCTTYADALITGNLITGNHADLGGGGINAYNFSEPVITNNIITNNTTDGVGGGIGCVKEAKPEIINNTITGNFALDAGGGVSTVNGAWPTLTNNILWGNSATSGNEIYVGTTTIPSTLTISSCDVKGGQGSAKVSVGSVLNWGTGMINAQPVFVEVAGGDFHLTLGSPCRNAGNSSLTLLPTEDFEGDLRIVGSAVDLGADEFATHLYTLGDVVPGGAISVRVTGTPAKKVTLALGTGVADPPSPTPHGFLYIPLPPANTWSIGKTSAQGWLAFGATIPLAWGSGSEHPLQALVGQWGAGGSELTNLLLLAVD